MIDTERLTALANYRFQTNWRCFDGTLSVADLFSQPDSAGTSISFPQQKLEGRPYWFTADLTFPQEIHGIRTAGARARLVCWTINPTKVFLYDKLVFSERYWSDFRSPEVLISPAVDAGTTYRLAVWIDLSRAAGIGGDVSIHVEVDPVESALFEVASFPYELDYCADFQELAPAVAAARRSFTDALDAGSDLAVLSKLIKELRQPLSGAALRTKTHTVHLIGHAHIDMNWLWDSQDTRDVIRRDFTTMDTLIRDEGITFSQSQVAVYEMCREDEPELFERVKTHVTSGMWEVTAATWTEGDLNLASGESIARHLAHSKEYCRRVLGRSSRLCWEPDTFGHPATMPQILRLSGIDYYYHMRCGEDYLLCLWEGLDGSRVLAFKSRYNNTINAKDIVGLAKKLRRDHRLGSSMHVYGLGDHGGGVSRRDIARARYLDSLPTMPRLKFSTAHQFFDSVSAAAAGGLPVEKGEMNPIFDGCYSSHADIKLANRALENRILEAEAAAALALARGSRADAGVLDDACRSLLFHQFHDIFDGCAIASTYTEAVPILTGHAEACAQACRLILADLPRSVGAQSKAGTEVPDAAAAGAAKGRCFRLWNLLGFKRTDIGVIDAPALGDWELADETGRRIPAQRFDGKLYFLAESIPAYASRRYTPVLQAGAGRADGPAALVGPDEDDRLVIENDWCRIVFDSESGSIVELHDYVLDHSFVRPDTWIVARQDYANCFSLEEEVPTRMSAWIIGPIRRVEYVLHNAELRHLCPGPVMDVLETRYRFGKSELTQRIFIYKQVRRIDFVTRLDWQEDAVPGKACPLLRVNFPLRLDEDVRVRYEIPFGTIERPATGREYPGQRWVDMADSKRGLALLNNGKYGFAPQGTTLRMTLARKSYDPDPDADRGVQEFSYSLLPHSTAVTTVQEAGAAFNSPLIPVVADEAQPAANSRGSRLPETRPITLLSDTANQVDLAVPGVHVSCLKPAIYAENHLVLRAYEILGRTTSGELRINFPVRRIWEVSLTEDERYRAIDTDGSTLRVRFNPHEIKTWELEPAGKAD
jgi:alpha-mannosidase